MMILSFVGKKAQLIEWLNLQPEVKASELDRAAGNIEQIAIEQIAIECVARKLVPAK